MPAGRSLFSGAAVVVVSEVVTVLLAPFSLSPAPLSPSVLISGATPLKIKPTDCVAAVDPVSVLEIGCGIPHVLIVS